MNETETSLVYVDAKPESILVRETYTYEIKIRVNPDTQLVDLLDHPDRPRGKITIEMPYDGYTNFPAESARQVLKGADISVGTSTLSGQIGWLALSRPLDWEREWKSPEGMDLLPVQIPLLDRDIQDPEMWVMDELRAVSRYEYQPESPNFIPLQVEMQVYDTAQDSQEEFKKTWRSRQNIQGFRRVSDLLKYLDGEPLQGGQLVIDVRVTASLPAILAQKNVQIVLDEFELKWPTIAPARQLKIFSLDQNRKENDVFWRYNPDHQTIEIQSVKAVQGVPEEGAPLVPYHCNLRMRLDFPGQVVSQDELAGQIRLRIDGGLLSGRQAAWLNAGGWRQAADRDLFTIETLLDARFIATLSDCFRNRGTAAYRQLYFSGVKLTPTRLDDIAAALRDIGYEITYLVTEHGEHFQNPGLIHINLTGGGERVGGDIEVGYVVARRVETSPDHAPVSLDMQVWAIPAATSPTRSERETEGGKVDTEWVTSDLILQIRGQMVGSGSLLSLDTDRLMVNLKNRFTAIADLR